MNRLVGIALLFSLVCATPLWAADSLLQSATRAAQTLARTEPLPSSSVPSTSISVVRKQTMGRPLAAQGQQQPGGLQSTGMRKRTKILIAIGAGAAFGAVAYAIDHGDVNNTPSTLGTRKD